jgi:biotin carboxyl carrier protein
MGRVLALFVAPGQVVEPGARLLTLEAMKIESTIQSPIAGTISEVRVGVGDQVDKRQLLLIITPSEPTP